MKRENDIVAATFVLLFVSAIVLPMSFIISRGIVNQARSLWFAEAKGTVLSRNVEISNNEGPSYAPKISYRYEVDGKTFRNDVISHEIRIFTEKLSNDFVVANPQGNHISVFYSPSNPQDSTATRGVTGSGLSMVVFMIPFNILFLVCAIGAWCVFSGKDEAAIDQLISTPVATGVAWLFWSSFFATAAISAFTFKFTDRPPSLLLVGIVLTGLALFFSIGCAKSFLTSE